VLVQVCGRLGEAWALPMVLLSQGVGTWGVPPCLQGQNQAFGRGLGPNFDGGRQAVHNIRRKTGINDYATMTKTVYND
jgi:hypothetical protein